MQKRGLFFILGALFFSGVMTARAENIGMARDAAPNARSQELTRMFTSLLGTWRGSYTYFDERQGQYVKGSGSLVFGTTPMPNVLTLDANTARPDGPPVHAFSVMVMQADGASWRQMAFTETGGRVQDKVITGYHRHDDRNWTVDMLEVQQGLGVASAVTVKMVVTNGHIDMRKFRNLEGGAPAAREYESFASFDKTK